jgi:hypothetical protein
MRPNILMPIMNFMTRYYHNYFHLLRSSSEYFSNKLVLPLLAGLIILVSSCEENPSLIGSKILLGTDFVTIKSTDSISVRSYTMFSDSVESGNPAVSYLGQLKDPYFGTTTAELVTQLRLGAEWDDKSFVIDSIKLFLKLLTVTGNVDGQHYLRFSKIADQLYADSAYYSSRPVTLSGYTSSDLLLPALKADTVNDIVIKLPDNIFGDTLTRDTSMFFHSSSKPDFRSYFRGLYFQLISSGDPIFVSLSVAPPGSYSMYSNYFTFYMKDNNASQKTFFFILDAVTRNASYNKYSFNRDAADPGKKILHIGREYRDTVSYVQTMNGVYTKIELPGLKTLKSDPSMTNFSINKARLIIPVFYDNNIYKPSTIPNPIYLRYITSTGMKYIVPDYSLNPSFFDGTADTTATVNVYNLNIPAFVQYYLDDKSDKIKPELEIFLSSGLSNNVILKANDSHPSIKFEFTYTKF